MNIYACVCGVCIYTCACVCGVCIYVCVCMCISVCFIVWVCTNQILFSCNFSPFTGGPILSHSWKKMSEVKDLHLPLMLKNLVGYCINQRLGKLASHMECCSISYSTVLETRFVCVYVCVCVCFYVMYSRVHNIEALCCVFLIVCV